MGISDFSPLPLNTDQQIAAGLLQGFIMQDIDRVFILGGHAGTGKTSLINALLKYLEHLEIPNSLLASTGRAAKVVGEKAGRNAITVHRCIYELELEETDNDNKIRRLFFKLRQNTDPQNIIYVVDECSMISDIKTEGSYTNYGTGKLLTDFFTFTGHRKVVFAGDPCQLPPVNARFSPSLNKNYLKDIHHKTVATAFLYEVMRYSKNSGVFYNTVRLRKQIEQNEFPPFSVKIGGFNDHKLFYQETQMVTSIIKNYRTSGIEKAIFICYTNAKAAELNRMIRAQLFPDQGYMQKGELLMVMQNNYKHDVANGEHLEVIEMDTLPEKQAGLTFRNVTFRVKAFNGYRILTGKIIEELLYAKEPNLLVEQDFILHRDFMIRTAKKGIRPKDEQFLQELLSDPYLNALRVKFGYAITCHKAQGGEWENIYLLFEKSLFMPNNRESLYRWGYTAISRSSGSVSYLDNYCIY